MFGIARNKTIGLSVCVGKAAANSLIKLDWRSLLAAGSLQPGRPTRACAHVNSSEVQNENPIACRQVTSVKLVEI